MFRTNMETTKNGNAGGGNTDWEERRLRTWSRSEVRLVEIVEGLCDRKDKRCNDVFAQIEQTIEDWYYSDDRDSTDLQELACSKALQACCKPGRYGPKCSRCPRDASGVVCGGRGTCDGEGSRAGTGRCDCDEGYGGARCETCEDGFERVGAACVDVDECRADRDPPACAPDRRCVNELGSFACECPEGFRFSADETECLRDEL
eukprot:Unigene2766_Nuclearia_a/m.8569 Unigene2766_Nuclearia_a/g.8569  ORF Unigene2766_Nuclearia_a/g.8569 Unigene2766_Nuclearia_a/m.8569 type:complete len:204 (-) Unigene2766_Nuclearia_a:35-646(-)